MSILLIRHGETELNAARVVQPADTPLSERGMRQADALALRLASEGVVAILCSDLPRATMTAAPFAAASGLQVCVDPVLEERNFGDLRGHAYDTLGFDPLAMKHAPPGGESEDAFRERVVQAFAAMLAVRTTLSGPLAVITHGLVIRVILDMHVSFMPGVRAPIRLENASVTRIAPISPYEVADLNCIRHLDASDRGAPHGISGI